MTRSAEASRRVMRTLDRFATLAMTGGRSEPARSWERCPPEQIDNLVGEQSGTREAPTVDAD